MLKAPGGRDCRRLRADLVLQLHTETLQNAPGYAVSIWHSVCICPRQLPLREPLSSHPMLLAQPRASSVPVSPPAGPVTVRTYGAAVGILTALALAIRLWVGLREPLWSDEAVFVAVASLPSWGEMFEFLRVHESHPPLYYVLMRLWFEVAGTSDAAAVLPGVFFGTALVPVLYAVGARTWSPRAGLTTALLATLSPVFVEHAVLARPYALLQLLFVASSFFLWRTFTSLRWRYVGCYVLTTAALLYTHHWAIMVLAAQGVAALVVALFSVDRGKLLRRGLVAAGGVVLLYALWAPILLHQATTGGHGERQLPPVYIAVTFLENTLWFGMRMMSANPALSALVLGLLAFYSWLFFGKRQRRAGGTGMLFWVALSVLSVTFAAALSPRSNLVLPRTVAIIAPGMLLALGAGLSSVRRPWIPASVLSAAYLAGLVWGVPPKSNAEQMAHSLARSAQSTDVVLFMPGHFSTIFHRYAPPPGREVTFPPIQPNGIDSYTSHKRLAADPAVYGALSRELEVARGEGRRVWLISYEATDQIFSDRPFLAAPASLESAWRRDHYRGLWRETTERYGRPAEPFGRYEGPARNEQVRVYLFAPQDK